VGVLSTGFERLVPGCPPVYTKWLKSYLNQIAISEIATDPCLTFMARVRSFPEIWNWSENLEISENEFSKNSEMKFLKKNLKNFNLIFC